MKKLFIILAFGLFSCSSDSTEEPTPTADCYRILATGTDSRGDYIIINYQDFIQRRYKVDNYQNYIGQAQLCEPITLIEQAL